MDEGGWLWLAVVNCVRCVFEVYTFIYFVDVVVCVIMA